eukprot:gene22391-biopygen2727
MFTAPPRGTLAPLAQKNAENDNLPSPRLPPPCAGCNALCRPLHVYHSTVMSGKATFSITPCQCRLLRSHQGETAEDVSGTCLQNLSCGTRPGCVHGRSPSVRCLRRWLWCVARILRGD